MRDVECAFANRREVFLTLTLAIEKRNSPPQEDFRGSSNWGCDASLRKQSAGIRSSRSDSNAIETLPPWAATPKSGMSGRFALICRI